MTTILPTPAPVNTPASVSPSVSSPPIAAGRVLTALVLYILAALPFVADTAAVGTEARLLLRAASVSLLCVAGLRLITGLAGNTHAFVHWRVGAWLPLWTAIGSGAASVTWLGPQTLAGAQRIALSSVVDALGLIAAGILMWTVGYLVGVPTTVRTGARHTLRSLLRGTTPEFRGAWLPWALYAAGSVARLANLVLTGGFGYLGEPSTALAAPPYANLISIVSMLCVFAIAVAAYQTFLARPPGGRLRLCLLVAAEVVVGALAGGKQSFVIAALAVLIPYAATRGRLPWRVLVVSAVLFAWIVVPFNTAYRDVVRGDLGALSPAAAMATAPGVLVDVVTRSAPGALLVTSADALLRRVRATDPVAIIAQRTPADIAYRSPLEFAVAPLIGITPRALWPGKPVFSTGYEFNQVYYGLPASYYSSSAITPLGDLYRHGGWLVLAVGMLAFGMGCRLFDTLFAAEADPRALFFLLVFLPVLVKSEVDLVALLVSVPSNVIACVLGVQLACRRSGSRGRAAHTPQIT